MVMIGDKYSYHSRVIFSVATLTIGTLSFPFVARAFEPTVAYWVLFAILVVFGGLTGCF